MDTIFEFFFKYRPLLFEKGKLAFQPPWPSYVTWLLAGSALVGAYLLYHKTKAVVPIPWRVGLAGLRGLSLLVLLVIFLQPVLILHTVTPQKSFVAVAYDVTKSMEIRDGAEGQSRIEIEKHLLRPVGNPMLEELGKKFKVRHFRFSNSATWRLPASACPRRCSRTR